MVPSNTPCDPLTRSCWTCLECGCWANLPAASRTCSAAFWAISTTTGISDCNCWCRRLHVHAINFWNIIDNLPRLHFWIQSLAQHLINFVQRPLSTVPRASGQGTKSDALIPRCSLTVQPTHYYRTSLEFQKNHCFPCMHRRLWQSCLILLNYKRFCNLHEWQWVPGQAP